MYGKVAQWFKFWAVNHDIIGSNPAETVYKFYFYFHIFFKSFCCRFFAYLLCSLFIYNHYNARTT